MEDIMKQVRQEVDEEKKKRKEEFENEEIGKCKGTIETIDTRIKELYKRKVLLEDRIGDLKKGKINPPELTFAQFYHYDPFVFFWQD